jgi:tetratricopeptide (TPR) repeat protein
MLAIQEGMTREIARALRVTIDERDAERLAKRVTENGEAYQLYLQGRFFWNQGMQPETNYLRAIEYFTLARNKDPNFALAYAGLADVYGSLPLWHVQPPSVSAPKAMEAVNRALSLDPNLAEAHSALAYIRMPFYEWATVEREFKEAIRLDRNLSPSHAGYSALLASLGRHEEALAEARTAQALDPLDVESRVMVGSVSYLARDFDRAIDELLRALEMDKDHGNTHYWLGLTLLAQRKFPQAVEELIKARSTIGEDDQDELVAQLVAYGAWGKTSDARKLLHDLHAMAGKRWVAPSSFAIAYGGLGDIGKVLDYLEQAYAEHDPFLVFLKTEPIWDPYRAEPRFKRLLDQMGFR